MFMDMDFPHPRKGPKAASRQASYASLVASATARQATSRTVSAMLSRHQTEQMGGDFAGSRISFFAAGTLDTRRHCASGAFWSRDDDNALGLGNRIELPVNLEGSTKGKAKEREVVMPEHQDTKWGTEL